MNVWIIDHYSSEPKYGGISRQFDFAMELSKRGYNVVVISSAFSHFMHEYIVKEKSLSTIINERFHYIYLKTTPYKKNRGVKRLINSLSFLLAVLKSKKPVAKKFGSPNVVVGCSVHPFTWIAAYFTAKKYKARFFAEVRDLWPASWIYNRGMSPHHPKALFFGGLQKWAFDRAEKIIYSMSRGDKYICDELGYPRKKVVWIDQPMDCARFDANAKRYDELPLDLRRFIGDSFLCVFTGYYVDYEGVYEMLKAAKLLEESNVPVKFVFVGSGQEESGMRRCAEESKLHNAYIGKRISKELIPALLRRAQICLAHLAIKGNINSYKFDASKNKINEYMYADACIIYGTYIRDHFVQTSGAGYTIEPYNGYAFAETIEKVYNMTEERRKLFGENGRRYIYDNNILSKLADKYVSILNG